MRMILTSGLDDIRTIFRLLYMTESGIMKKPISYRYNTIEDDLLNRQFK